MMHGDLGNSYMNNMSVSWLLSTKLTITVQLTVGALLMSLLISMPLALLGATRRFGLVRPLISSYYALSLAVPIFWLGLLLSLLFGVQLGWLPPSGYVALASSPIAWLQHMILPWITLGIAISAFEGRFLQASLETTLAQDYIRTARAKGLSPRLVLRKHALRNSLIPLVTSLALQAGAMMGGAVLTEAIFGLPGLGLLLWQATLDRDYAVIQGAVLFVVSGFVILNLAADLAYALLDPRIRYG